MTIVSVVRFVQRRTLQESIDVNTSVKLSQKDVSIISRALTEIKIQVSINGQVFSLSAFNINEKLSGNTTYPNSSIGTIGIVDSSDDEEIYDTDEATGKIPMENIFQITGELMAVVAVAVTVLVLFTGMCIWFVNSRLTNNNPAEDMLLDSGAGRDDSSS